MDLKQDFHRILMLPWLAHGHVSPFLELAKKLTSSRNSNFQVYLCSTPVNLTPIREILADNNNHLGSIQCIDIHLPTNSELPPEYQTTKNLPPHLMPVLKTAFDEAKGCFLRILRKLKPHLVVYDFLQPFAPSVAQEERIPSVLFLNCAASTNAFLVHCTEHPDLDYPIPELNFSKNTRWEIVKFMYDVSNGVTNKERYLECIEKSSSFVLVKTLNEIEQKHIDYFSKLVEKEVIPVGPLVQEPKDKSSDLAFMEWLSKRDFSSVVFVSFGSEYFLSKEEIEEIAYGLEISMVSFIWVVRFHGRENVSSSSSAILHEILPEGFQERVAERGMVVEDWAPQAKILSHPSIGGFVSHCGWSSTLESIAFGVPIIAMPMQLDQPLNARLVVESGVGIEVQRENGKFRKEEIARVIKEVVVQEEGKDVRKKVQELSSKIKEKGDQEIDHVVKRLLQLVIKE
ncbi:hypothetical protein ACH5RR_021085 [Cinchona calisaya]|uniref:Glycosyltransferase n=1 Tax=Cinchona calisaya TaxID=153742 RepID=A0ABD2ZG98_9GENT